MTIQLREKRRGTIALLLSFVFCLSACASKPWQQKPVSTVSLPGGATVHQSGNVENPAKATVYEAKKEIPLPADTKVSVVSATEKEPEKVEIVLRSPSVMKWVEVKSDLQAAKTVAPPTPKELAAASATESGVKLWYWLGGGLVIAALALGYFGHLKAAVIAFGGGVLLPILAQSTLSEYSGYVALGFVCVSLTLVVAWYLVRSRVRDSGSTTPQSN